MSEFGGSWKHQNNPACTESVRVYIISNLDAMPKKKNLVNSVLFLLYKNGKTVLHNIFVAEIVV